MAQLFINIIGHNASGKTTLAKRLEQDLNLSCISGDDFRYFVKEHIRYFNDLDISYPTERGKQLRPLTINYRLQLSQILLEAQESVLFDGSGFKKSDRQPIQAMLGKFPDAKYVIILAAVPENELLKRLEARGNRWIDMYHDLRKPGFERPTADEADVLLEYNQHNYDEIREKIEQLII